MTEGKTPAAASTKRSETAVHVASGQDPFQASWRQEFWYKEAVREKRLNLLLHLAPYSAVLLMTGDEGSGKTTLLHQFLARAQDTWRICHIQGAADIDDVAILDSLYEELSLRGDAQADGEARIRHLRDSLHTLRRGALVPLAVIDDAHLLPQAALTMIGQLTEPRDDGAILLGAILCGDDSIEERFALPGLGSLRERVSHSFDLPPLGEESTAEYIRHRMRVTGRTPDGPFTPAVMKFIHVASRGMPGRINELARGVLRNEYQIPDTPAEMLVPRSLERKALLRYGVAALVISLVVVALFYQDTLKEFATVDPLPVVRDTGIPSAPLPGILAQPGAATVDPSIDSDPSPEEPHATDADVAEALVVAESDAASDDAAEEVAVDTAGADAESAPAAEPEPVQEPVVEPAPQVVEAAPETSPPASAPDTGASEFRDAAWLLAQPPGHFTLQLFASSEERARAFIVQHALEDEAALFRSTAGERPLVAVVYGVYPDRQSAVQAGGQALIEAIPGVEPWIRSLRDVQAVIGRAGSGP